MMDHGDDDRVDSNGDNLVKEVGEHEGSHGGEEFDLSTNNF